jgi:hypothetical protein
MDKAVQKTIVGQPAQIKQKVICPELKMKFA